MKTSAFDPTAATNAYLAMLEPAQSAKALAYTQGGHWLLLWSWVVTLVVCWLVVRSTLLDRLQAKLSMRKPRPNLTAFVCVSVFNLLRWVLTLPWSGYSEWSREHAYGMTRQPFADWLAQGAIQAVISALLGGLFFVAVYALIRRAGRWWPAWAMGVAGLFSAGALVAAPIFLLPIFNHYGPAPQGQVRDMVEQLAKANSVPAAKVVVYDGSRQSNRFTASVVGIGGSAQIAMSDVMFQKNVSVAEVRAVVGHEIGHYKHGDLLILAGVLTVLFGVGFWLIDRLFTPAARLFGLPRPDLASPAGMPVVSALIAMITLLLSPLINTAQRAIELRADNYSLEHVRDPDALVLALLRSADYRYSSPTGLEEALFYDHPSIRRRIRNAMDWKADHAGQPPT